MAITLAKQSGKNVGLAPDVSKTPTPSGPVPIPYPSSGVGHDALVLQTQGYTKTGAKNLAEGKPPGASLDRFKVASSTGDEAGALKGVSSKVRSSSRMMMGAPVMSLGKLPAVRILP